MGDSLRQTVCIKNPQGFHMRPMAAFVEAANKFPCAVVVSRDGVPPANGKSILALMGLVAVEGTELIIEVNGDCAADALKALVEVLERTYEDE
jgi:phosphotransferase system HPr (HPr) family protein